MSRYSAMRLSASAESGAATLAERTGDRAGLIVIDPKGNISFAHNTSRTAFGHVYRDHAPYVAIKV